MPTVRQNGTHTLTHIVVGAYTTVRWWDCVRPQATLPLANVWFTMDCLAYGSIANAHTNYQTDHHFIHVRMKTDCFFRRRRCRCHCRFCLNSLRRHRGVLSRIDVGVYFHTRMWTVWRKFTSNRFLVTERQLEWMRNDWSANRIESNQQENFPNDSFSGKNPLIFIRTKKNCWKINRK